MKKCFIFVMSVLFTSTLFLPNVFAQGSTRFELPPGAIKRLGKGWIKDLQFSPYGSHLAVATTIGIWIYDVNTGEEINLLKGHMRGVNAIEYSPDGSILAAAHENRTVCLWGRDTHVFEGHTGDIRALAFSIDGRMVASGDSDNKVRIWDVHAKKLRAILPEFDAPVSTLTFSADSSMLAGGSQNGEILVWDTGTGEPIYEYANGHTEAVSDVIFLADEILVSSSLDGDVQLWSLIAPGGPLPPPKKYPVAVHAIAAILDRSSSDSDEYILAAGTADKLIRIWNMTIHQQTASFGQEDDVLFDKHTDSVRNVTFSPDGRTLASASLDGTVQIWDWRGRRQRFTLPAHTGPVKALTYTTDNRIYACGTGLDGKLRLWDAGTGVVLSVLHDHIGLTETAAFSWDGKTLASAGREDGKIFLSDVETALKNKGRWSDSSLETILTGNRAGITALTFSPAGNTLATGGLDGKIQLLDITTRRELDELRGPEGTVTALRFAGDGTFLASGEENGTVRYWDSLVGEENARFQGNLKAIGALAFSPSTPLLAIGNTIGEIWLYNYRTDNGTTIPTQHTRKITALVFASNGRTLVSGSEDGTILLWDTEKPLQRPQDYRLKTDRAEPFIQMALNATVAIGSGRSQGTGFFIGIGYVATNHHVIKGGGPIYAKSVANQTNYTVEQIVDVDERNDLAILRVSGASPPILSLENSDDIEIGETVYTVGNPIGLEGTVSKGIVSSIRDVGNRSLIQIDAPTSPGSSGGPVLNEAGKVIGVSVSGISGTDAQNLNFAVPANYLKALLRRVQ